MDKPLSCQQNTNIVIRPQSHVVIVGLGKSGISAVRFCLGKKARVSVSDQAPLEQLDEKWCAELEKCGVYLESGGHSQSLFDAADLVLVSPGVPFNAPIFARAKAKGIPVVGEMALAMNYLKTPMLAVSGTNGKTTVTTLLGEMFRASGKKVFVGGNIGTPLTDYLAGTQKCDAVILEISSFQLDTAASLKPQVAVLLNITADHLDRYSSFEAYAQSKCSLFQNQRNGDVSIVNADDPVSQQYLMENATSLQHGWEERSTFYYGHGSFERGAVLQQRKVILVEKSGQGEEEIFDLSGTAFAESPNLGNCGAAILAARALGCSRNGIRRAIQRFTALPHRLMQVAEIQGVSYIDDSKATNVGAVHSALSGLPGPVVLIAGGRDKGGDYSSLRALIQKKVKALFLIGEAKEKMAKSFDGLTRIGFCHTLEEAVSQARVIASDGDTVLLSPACASFDMFHSYSERGTLFAHYVKAGLDLEQSQ